MPSLPSSYANRLRAWSAGAHGACQAGDPGREGPAAKEEVRATGQGCTQPRCPLSFSWPAVGLSSGSQSQSHALSELSWPGAPGHSRDWEVILRVSQGRRRLGVWGRETQDLCISDRADRNVCGSGHVHTKSEPLVLWGWRGVLPVSRSTEQGQQSSGGESGCESALSTSCGLRSKYGWEKRRLVSLFFFFLQDTSCLKMPAEKECPLPNGMALL